MDLRLTPQPPGRSPGRGLVTALALLCLLAPPAFARGKVQGRVLTSDTREPIAFADVLLIPADTTLARVGGLTNVDGTFAIEAVAGKYTVQVRALSYAKKLFENVVLADGAVLPLDAELAPEAILQKEVLVEARAKLNTEAGVLTQRRKAGTVGDAVSAEQVRRSGDRNAADVLRRVTGLSVSDGKYVFVRGLGERYSSTEVDGVRIASPEQNRRVVPLDLVPASLLENVVVQKTYTADRPGEFGGGDVEVRTKDFPGKRTWAFSVSQGIESGVTFHDRQTYGASAADIFGFGAAARALPGEITQLGDVKLAQGSPPFGFPVSKLTSLTEAFTNVWTPHGQNTVPNGSYSITFGDEYKLMGRSLGVILSSNLDRTFDHRNEQVRYFQDPAAEVALYDYATERFNESAQLGGLAGVSFRLTPNHMLHARGLFTNSADDEVRTYEGVDRNRIDDDGNFLVHHNTRLLYVQRSVFSASLDGQHDLKRWLDSSFRWKFARSRARRQQPDRRETTYDLRWIDVNDQSLGKAWQLGSVGRREFGDLTDDGWGTTFSWIVPLANGKASNARMTLGYDRQTKHRDNGYRRFAQHPQGFFAGPAETLFTGQQGPFPVYVDESTLDVDNYTADQRLESGFMSADFQLWTNLRGNVGVRLEHGVQSVKSFDLFDRSRITAEGDLDDVDWLPSGNVNWSMSRSLVLRAGASRTLSRPDLNELSPSPALEYVGGFQVTGNPDLHRATIENYDLRLEAFPGLSEVLAAGVFLKRLHEPIEQAIKGGSPDILKPVNSDHGRNVGVELEARVGLGRLTKKLDRLSVNTNASFISSRVKLKPDVTVKGTQEHPLQGQATYVLNGALSYATPGGGTEAALMFTATGWRLAELNNSPLPDIYEAPTSSLDATFATTPWARWRLKFTARNMLDPRVRRMFGEHEESGYYNGRSFSAAVSFGS